VGYIPQFRFVLDDLSHADDSALRGRSLTAVAAAGLMLLARGRAKAAFSSGGMQKRFTCHGLSSLIHVGPCSC